MHVERRLPVEAMLRDVDTVNPTDKDCHVMALVEEVKALARACAVAYNHIDTYGCMTPGLGREVESQNATFHALHPFVKALGHTSISVYDAPPSSVKS